MRECVKEGEKVRVRVRVRVRASRTYRALDQATCTEPGYGLWDQHQVVDSGCEDQGSGDEAFKVD